MVDTITIKKPFDAHVHLRRGAVLRAVTKYSAERFDKAIVMPNTEPPIDTLDAAIEYKNEILAALPSDPPAGGFEPLMTLYLTKNLTPDEIARSAVGAEGTKIYGVKYYPYGATTNSQWGYRDILEAKDVLKEMERAHMPLMLHGEVHIDSHEHEVDPYEGERRFIEDVFPRLLETCPDLQISLEHMSTRVAADFMEKNGREGQLVATVTPHHLMYAREDIEHEPLLRCKPLIKSRTDRDAVRALAARGLPFISAGTDSAPHPEQKKLTPPGAYGVFSAPEAVELYTEVFDALHALDKLEGFLSLHGPHFFGVEPSSETITLERREWSAEPVLCDDGIRVIPMTGNTPIHWRIRS